MSEEVRAAGGVVWRRDDTGAVEVLIVHRDRYDDWTFPKGKLDPGESWEEAAVREVLEETGIVAILGPELAQTEYVDNRRRQKRARYWAMAVAADSGFEAGEEISDRVWMSTDEVAVRLTYERDLAVLESFIRSSV